MVIHEPLQNFGENHRIDMGAIIINCKFTIRLIYRYYFRNFHFIQETGHARIY